MNKVTAELPVGTEPQLEQTIPTTCTYCLGNDKDMPCAYPSEGRAGCLRDKRLNN